MRITQNQLRDQTLFNLQNNINRLSDLQNQLSTGKKVNRPSDDPIDFPKSLSRRTTIQLGRSHLSNINGARTNLDLTETSMGSLTDVMQRIRQLAVQGANETIDAEGREAVAKEVNELFGQVLDLANSHFNGQFIFGGSETEEQPFVRKDGTILYRGDNLEREVTISKQARISSNINGFQSFLHTPNEITASVSLKDPNAPLAEQLEEVNPQFSNTPPLPDTQPGSNQQGSPNPANSPTPRPNNFASFSIHGEEIQVDLSVDSLNDVKNRINNNLDNVTASINEENQLTITSKRADALELRDGERDTGFPPERPLGSNFFAALGMHRRVEGNRNLTIGFPATDPLTDPNADPPPSRGNVRVQDDSFLFANTNTGPSEETAVPFGDNLALTEVDAQGNEKLDENGRPTFVDELESLRFTIDDETVDLNLRELTQGADFDGTEGNEDDVPGSTLGDMLNFINNHPKLEGKVQAFVSQDGNSLSISATESTDTFKVENARTLFGRDITTSVEVDPNTGEQTVTRTDPISQETKLEDLPGALVDSDSGESLGVRLGEPVAGSDLPDTNTGLVSISNQGETDTVDLREAETVGDVLRAFNESSAGVKASINEEGTGINVTSNVGDDDALSIRDIHDGTTARDLGLFNPPQPARIQSTNNNAFTPDQTVDDVANLGSDGEFSIEVRDSAGTTLETYSVDVSGSDTLEEVVNRIDGIDGEAGPGGGLISANLSGGQLNIVSNFDGQSLYVDPSNDTTGSGAADRFTEQLGINQYTAVEESSVPQEAYESKQDTAGLLGLSGEGNVNEVSENNIFRSISRLERGLRNDDTEAIQNSLENLDIDLENVNNTRTTLGARLNRLESTKSRLEQAEDLTRQQLSLEEDADLAQLITDLTSSQNAFQASLQASSRTIQLSLLNFLQ